MQQGFFRINDPYNRHRGLTQIVKYTEQANEDRVFQICDYFDSIGHVIRRMSNDCSWSNCGFYAYSSRSDRTFQVSGEMEDKIRG